VIACSPNIVLSPTSTTGLPANSLVAASPGNLFSAALQAATQNLLHPSLKSQVGLANPAQHKPSPLNLKPGTASGNLFQQSPSAQQPGTTSTAVQTDSVPVQVLPAPVLPTQVLPPQGPPVAAAPPVPPAAPPQPATVYEAKLQAATLGAEQNQSATQIARVATVAATAQTILPATTGFQQVLQVASQFGPGTTAITGVNTAVLAGPQTAPLSSASPEQPQAGAKGTLPNASQQPNLHPLDELGPLSAPAGKETDPVQTESPNASSALANQPALAAHSTKPSSHPLPGAALPAGNAPPLANPARSVPSQPEHSGVPTEAKSQTTEASGVPAVVDSRAPQIPLQLVAPDMNVIKVSPKPVEALPTAPALTGSSSVDAAQPATEISNRNGDASGSKNTQSGTGNGGTTSFTPMAASSPSADNGITVATKDEDVSASAVLVGMQAAHGVVSANNTPGTSAKTDAPTIGAFHFPASGTAEPEARAQAAASYANSLLHSARLVERVGQSELRVGIQAGEFGNVDIRTSMVRNQFTAQISVERGELGKVLASELPNLQNKLSEQRLPGANIILQNQSGGGSAGFGQGSRQSQTMQQIVIPQSSEGEPAPTFMGLADASVSTERLDVHM